MQLQKEAVENPFDSGSAADIICVGVECATGKGPCANQPIEALEGWIGSRGYWEMVVVVVIVVCHEYVPFLYLAK